MGRALNRVDRAVIEALVPSGANDILPLGALDSGFEEFLGEFERLGAPELRRAFGLSLVAAGWIAPFLVRRLPPLSRLGAADRERALEAMETTNITLLRQLALVLKTVVALHYGALPSVRASIGYHA